MKPKLERVFRLFFRDSELADAQAVVGGFEGLPICGLLGRFSISGPVWVWRCERRIALQTLQYCSGMFGIILRLRPCRRPLCFGLLLFDCLFLPKSMLQFVLDPWWPHVVAMTCVLQLTVISGADVQNGV